MALLDGSSLTLPVPVDKPGRERHFDAAADLILQAYTARKLGTRSIEAGEPAAPADEIPPEYQRYLVDRIERYGAPVRRQWKPPVPTIALILRFKVHALLFVLFALGAVGVAGSIHSYTRDLPAYDAYRHPAPCTADSSVIGTAASEYCDVRDGVVTGIIGYMPNYEIGVGPSISVPSDLSPLLQDPNDAASGPAQLAPFANDEPALDNLQLGEHVDYLALNGGDVLSVTVDGVTYQTDVTTPQPQQVYDLATILASSMWTLMFAYLLGLRLARRRLTLWSAVPLAACAGAFFTNTAVAGRNRADLSLSLSGLVILTSCIALGAAAAITTLRLLMGKRTSNH